MPRAAGHSASHPIPLPPHTRHLPLPAVLAAVVSASHSAAPYVEGEDGKAKRPPSHEPENDQCDPGGFADFIQLCGDGHCRPRVNVNNIYIARPVRGSCQAARILKWVSLTFCASPERKRLAEISPPRSRRGGKTTPAQIAQPSGPQKFSRHKGKRPPSRIAAAEQRSDTVGHRPDVQRDHQRRWAPLRRHQRNQLLCSRSQHGESVLARLTQLTVTVKCHSGLEHC